MMQIFHDGRIVILTEEEDIPVSVMNKARQVLLLHPTGAITFIKTIPGEIYLPGKMKISTDETYR